MSEELCKLTELESKIAEQTSELRKANGQLLLELADRVKVEIALRDSENQMRSIFENALNAMVILDDDRRVLDANASALELFGKSKEALVGSRWEDHIPGTKHGAIEERWRAFLHTGVRRGETEVRRGDGLPRCVAFSSRANVLPGRHLVSLQDVTDRKRAEHLLRELSRRLMKLQDEERRRIARDLHDSIGQSLAALRMNLDVVERESSNLGPQAQKALQDGLSLCKNCETEVRTISYLLHPPLLDEIGLVAALRWYAEGFSQRSGIQVALNICDTCKRLPMDLSTALFRIIQESLTNIHRHSGSETARIRLGTEEGRIILEVSDQGRGLAAEKQSSCSSGVDGLGVGITGMHERVQQLGGEMKISSGSPGTIVTASFPMKSTEAKDGTASTVSRR